MDHREVATQAPLAGMRVLEIAPPEAGAVTRFLAELGADVIARRQPGRGDAVSALVGSTGKRLLRADPASAEGRARLAALAADADILIETRLDSRADEVLAGELLAAIRARNPRVVILSASPFGKNNSLAHWQMTSSVIDALSGVLARSGWPGREPLLPPGELALQCAYNQACWVALLAYFNALRSGHGDLIDLSLVEAAAQSLDPGFGIGGSATAGVPASQLPRGRPEARHMYPILPCKDGHVRICVLAPRQWQGMFAWMGKPEKYADPEFNKVHVRFHSPTLLGDIATRFASKTRAELERELATAGVPMAPVLTLAEAMDSEQLVARQATVAISDGAGREVRVPNGLVEIDGARAGAGAAAVEMADGEGWRAPERFAPAPEAVAPERPFSGLTVLDFGVIIAGGEQSRLFADQGATTIKTETRAFPDGGRQSATGEAISGNFAMGHRNKLGLGLNLRDPRGKALFLELAVQSDLVLSNFKPGTLRSLGLDYAAVRAVNPGIVMGDSSAYGPTGPWAGRPGYGPLVRASSGMADLWSYGPAEFSDAMTVYPDHVCGRIVAIASLSLLIRRMRTGQGGEASLAQAEAIVSHLGETIAAASLGVERPKRPDAPWGVYPCAGEDEWCVVTVHRDDDWQKLGAAIGRGDLAGREDLASSAGRLAAAAELDAAVSAWTATQAPDAAMETLQAAGVPAARMLRVFEMPEFALYRERGAMHAASHPLIVHGFQMEHAMFHSERIPHPAFGPAPLPGEQTARLVRERLGRGDAEIARLHEEGVLESTSLPA